MYLYKYLYKGVDHTKQKIKKDEIQKYLGGRYLSASEAAYRTFEFDINQRIHSVKYYRLRLQNKNWIVFQTGALESAVPAITTFERYFVRAVAAVLNNFTYLEYSKQYMVTPQTPKNVPGHEIQFINAVIEPCHVCERRDIHVARMGVMKPNAGEQWYLEQIVTRVPG